MLKRGKKSNVLGALILIAGMFGLVIAMTQLVLKDTVSSQSLRIISLEQKYDSAKNILYSAFEGSVLIAVRDYCLKGYGKNSSLWVENLQLIPDSNERKEALIYHLNKSIIERVQTTLFENPDFDSKTFKLNSSQIELKLEQKDYLDTGGVPHEGYDIHINKVKLESTNPKGYTYFNYTFSFPLVWIIYDGIKEYIDSATYGMLGKLADLTNNKICNNAECACGSHLFPLTFGGMEEYYITEAEVRPIVDQFVIGLKNHMQNKGIECDYRYLGFHVTNVVTSVILKTGVKGDLCSTSTTAKTRSPWQLDVWANEDALHPGEPLPYQIPYYDYEPYYSSFARNSGVSDLDGWPVNLNSASKPPNASSSFEYSSDWAYVHLNKIYRGAAALIEFYCEDPSHIVIGANPEKPSEVGNLRTRVRFRINTVANCPDPDMTAQMDFKPATDVSCPDCQKASCAASPTAKGCETDIYDTPDHPVEVCGETGDKNGKCDRVCDEYCNTGTTVCGGPQDCPNIFTIDCTDTTCDTTMCEGEGCQNCEKKDGKCLQKDQCVCHTNAFQQACKLDANNPNKDCPPMALCKSGVPTCACRSCFPAGTRITLTDGSVREIEKIKVGDEVLGYDTISQKEVAGTVCGVESPMRDGYYVISFADNTTLNITEEHPIFARAENYLGWAAIRPDNLFLDSKMKAKELRIGNEVLKTNNRWIKIKQIRKVKKAIKTYNLKCVTNTNTFFAEDVLVHNKTGPPNPGEPGYTPPPPSPGIPDEN